MMMISQMKALTEAQRPAVRIEQPEHGPPPRHRAFRVRAPVAPSSSILTRRPRAGGDDHSTVSVPVMFGCTVQTNGYAPAASAGTW